MSVGFPSFVEYGSNCGSPGEYLVYCGWTRKTSWRWLLRGIPLRMGEAACGLRRAQSQRITRQVSQRRGKGVSRILPRSVIVPFNS